MASCGEKAYLDEHHPERPHVHLRAIGLPQHLRRKILRGAPLVREAAVGLDGILVGPIKSPERNLSRQAEVANLHDNMHHNPVKSRNRERGVCGSVTLRSEARSFSV